MSGFDKFDMVFITLVGPAEWRKEHLGSVGGIYWVDKGQEIKENLKERLLVSREELFCLEGIDLGFFLLITDARAFECFTHLWISVPCLKSIQF